ncbi:HesA/MoeB/ThiF family protein [Saccharospirillum impatiens]|uniref:HesA/MoeB/ThiF family protein n=1 Tax=Saccharospirillum impatiens TaxID=169438 RepID=UPI0004081F9B|nr:ThiF family adenylyltransferase [Saccharospirillum impatiens]
MNLGNVYRFSYTQSAMQEGNDVLIGSNLARTVSFSFDLTSKTVIDALSMIDGKASLADIIASSGLSDDDVSEFVGLVSLFIDNNVVELFDEKEKAKSAKQIQSVDYERFDRQINLFKHALGSFDQAIDVQNRLDSCKVAIVGLGGCGSYVFYTLSAMGIGSIKSYEFDNVERSNLSRQVLYTHDDIGRPKAEVAEEKGKKISPTTDFIFVNKMILSIEDAVDVFEDVELVICSADNPRPAFFELMNKAAYMTDTPLLYAGSSTTNAVVGPLVIPGSTRCYKCINYVEPTEQFDFVKNIQREYFTTLIDPYNAVSGSLAALEAIKFLTEFDECQIIESTMFFDFSNYEVDKDSNVYSGRCAICSP